MEISGKVVVIGEIENVGQKGFTKRLLYIKSLSLYVIVSIFATFPFEISNTSFIKCFVMS